MPDDGGDGANGIDGQAEYQALVERLAGEARAADADPSDPAAREDAVWNAVGGVVPSLTRDVCEAVLTYADRDPDEALVAEVTSERDSGDAERLRAEAVTVLVADVRERI